MPGWIYVIGCSALTFGSALCQFACVLVLCARSIRAPPIRLLPRGGTERLPTIAFSAARADVAAIALPTDRSRATCSAR